MPTSDGTGAQMPDGMAPESAPEAQREPVPPSLAAAFGTPPPPPPASSGRRRRWGFIGLAIVAILGLAIGLLVAQPWEPPPLLAPVAVRAAATSTTGAAISWHQAPGGRKPDSWVVVRNGERYAVVPGTQLTFTDSKLAPGGSYAYRIYETSGTAQSRGSALASVKTTAPSVRNLRQVGKGWTTVTLRWDTPTGAPTPDNYTITDSNGSNVGRIAGNVTTYTITHLPVGGDPVTYTVFATWSGNQSDSAPSVQAVTRQPPLNGDYSTGYYDASSPGGTMTTGTKWTDNWTFTPSCAGNACNEGLHASFEPPATSDTPFNVTLKPSGGHYVGTTHAEIFACSSTTSTSILDSTNDTVNVDITPVHTSGGVWTSFTGTVLVTMPYTVPVLQSGYYCPTQSWTFTVNGHPGS
ncbi:MAG: hypothetical protein JWM19_2794 [Actinomycetia bacterium]|nr:hypothetical protein [Actinomycetes bacterium]